MRVNLVIRSSHYNGITVRALKLVNYIIYISIYDDTLITDYHRRDSSFTTCSNNPRAFSLYIIRSGNLGVLQSIFLSVIQGLSNIFKNNDVLFEIKNKSITKVKHN